MLQSGRASNSRLVGNTHFTGLNPDTVSPVKIFSYWHEHQEEILVAVINRNMTKKLDQLNALITEMKMSPPDQAGKLKLTTPVLRRFSSKPILMMTNGSVVPQSQAARSSSLPGVI